MNKINPKQSELVKQPCSFLDGYFTQQFDAGERPDYGYPKTNLPETSDESMEVITGFMVSSK